MRCRAVGLLALGIALIMPATLFADAANPTFADDVSPIIRQSCQGCHSDDKQKGGLNLATFAAAMQGGSSGAAVVPGKPAESRLFTLTNHQVEPKMPPKAEKIAAGNIDIIRKWIEQGARETSNSKAAVAPKIETAVALNTTVKGRPAVPPMPGKLLTEPVVSVRRSGTISALAASPWAPLIAIGGARQITLYHSDTAERLGVLPFPAGQVNALRFSRNGKLLLAAGGRGGQSGKASLYDLATGKILIEVGLETDALLDADLSADQSLIAVGSPSKLIRVYSTKDGTLVREIKKHTDWVTAVEFSPDGVLLASGDRNGGLAIWETNTGREFHALRGPTAMITSLSWRDDANALAVASEDGTVRLFEMENGTQTKTWPAHGGGATSVKFAHDGRLASTGRDRITKLWDAAGAQQRAFEAFNDLGLQVAVTHDMARVVAGDWAGSVRVWSAADGKLLATLDANPLPAAERLARAEKAVVEAEAKLKQAMDALAAAKAAADKVNADHAALQKAINDAAAVNATAQTALVAVKADLDKQPALVAAALAAEQARGVSVQALTEAANKVAEAAKSQPANAELKAQAAKVNEIANAARAHREVAKKATLTATGVQQTATAQHEQAKNTAAATAAAVPVAQQKLVAAQAANKPVLDAANAALARVTDAQAALVLAKQQLEREKPAAPKK